MKARARRLYAACLIVLACGLAAGALVYFTAEDSAPPGSSYVVIDGVAYAVEPGASKRYVRDLQRFGGKASVVFDELNRWFGSLWHGTRLGVTLAWLSIAVSAILFYLAWYEDR